jgi:chromosomal replication initiation ATPase DnaA
LTTTGKQLRLKLNSAVSHARADFVVSQCNAAAVAALDRWPAWPGGGLALVGPPGCGKSHLALSWARANAASIIDRSRLNADAPPLGPVLIEDADQGVADDTLFHLINRTDAGATLLITARTAPLSWPTALPDLRSRLNALIVAQIEEPDDAVLEAVLRKLFRERNIRPADDLVPYLIRRIERSVLAAKDVVCRLDELADAESREVTRTLARRLLEQDDRTVDLFE